jgi:hypothetical protein
MIDTPLLNLIYCPENTPFLNVISNILLTFNDLSDMKMLLFLTQLPTIHFLKLLTGI